MDTTEAEPGDGPAQPSDAPERQRLEIIAAVLLAVATVLIAWSAFQSAKWGGAMAVSYSSAGAARTASNRAATLAGQQTIIDVQLFTDWLSALDDEQGQVLPTPYEPNPARCSTADPSGISRQPRSRRARPTAR